MSGQGFFGKDKDRDRSSRDGSPSSSPSTSRPASKNWLPGKMAFLYSKRKPSLPLQSHYLSLPVGGAAAVTSPTGAGAGGMYMLHSEDLSMTEFAKLAGITIVQDEDDPTTYDSHIIGDEIHEHCRRGSSTTELIPLPGGLPGLDCGTSGSAGNTLDSDKNLTVGSNGSFGGGSLRKTQIWDPQFWSDPVRDGTMMTNTIAMVSSNNLLPSASTSSLPATSGSFATRPPVPALVGSSAPNSPKLKPQSSLPSSGPFYEASSSSAPTNIQTTAGTTSSILSPPVPVHQQRRRNSCSLVGLMPAAGSRTVATAATVEGSEIDHTRHPTSSGLVSLKRTDQQQLPRPPSKDAIQLSQDLSRRRSFTSLTAVALELEGDVGENGQVQDLLQAGGARGAVGGGRGALVTPSTATTTTTPYVFLEPSTPTTPTKTSQLAIPSAPSMSHTLAMHALHTPRSRSSVPGSGGGYSSRAGVSRTRSPSPSPLSRQIDLDSLESPQEEKCDPLDMLQRRERTNSSLTQLSPSPLMTPPPSASKGSRQCFTHGASEKIANPTVTAKGPGSVNKNLTPTHIDLLKAQQAQRRASLDEMGIQTNEADGEKKGLYLSPTSSSSTFSLAKEEKDAVLDSTEWAENPTLNPEDNVRVFQLFKVKFDVI
ncbi:hypothetical protein BGZ47_002405 [Haplosporangium gracile]|nr:hypothetical protein BGZ47_002405 [Haplosporangium gracile]